jgi:hypothetical protein
VLGDYSYRFRFGTDKASGNRNPVSSRFSRSFNHCPVQLDGHQEYRSGYRPYSSVIFGTRIVDDGNSVSEI